MSVWATESTTVLPVYRSTFPLVKRNGVVVNEDGLVGAIVQRRADDESLWLHSVWFLDGEIVTDKGVRLDEDRRSVSIEAKVKHNGLYYLFLGYEGSGLTARGVLKFKPPSFKKHEAHASGDPATIAPVTDSNSPAISSWEFVNSGGIDIFLMRQRHEETLRGFYEGTVVAGSSLYTLNAYDIPRNKDNLRECVVEFLEYSCLEERWTFASVRMRGMSLESAHIFIWRLIEKLSVQSVVGYTSGLDRFLMVIGDAVTPTFIVDFRHEIVAEKIEGGATGSRPDYILTSTQIGRQVYATSLPGEIDAVFFVFDIDDFSWTKISEFDGQVQRFEHEIIEYPGGDRGGNVGIVIVDHLKFYVRSRDDEDSQDQTGVETFCPCRGCRKPTPIPLNDEKPLNFGLLRPSQISRQTERIFHATCVLLQLRLLCWTPTLEELCLDTLRRKQTVLQRIEDGKTGNIHLNLESLKAEKANRRKMAWEEWVEIVRDLKMRELVEDWDSNTFRPKSEKLEHYLLGGRDCGQKLL